MFPRHVLSILLIIVISCVSVSAQESAAPPATPPKIDPELKKKAIDLLVALAGQLGTLQSAENRARIGANLADSLWDYDEKQSRALFMFVAENVKEGLAVESSQDANVQHTFEVFMKLRTNTIQRLAQHDPELAYNFLKATPGRTTQMGWETFGEESMTEAELARLIAARRPELGLEMGRKLLNDGLRNNLSPLVVDLYKKDKSVGVTLHQEIVRTLRGQEFDWGTRAFLLQLVSQYPPEMLKEETVRDLLDVVIATGVEHGCRSKSTDTVDPVCISIGETLPVLQKIDSVRTKQFSHLAQVSSDDSSESDLGDSEDVAELVEFANKNPQMAGELLRMEMSRAAANGDVERARQLAEGFKGDPGVKATLMKWIEKTESWSVMNEQMMGQLEKELGKLELPLQKFQLLIYVANQVSMKKDSASVLKLLNRANSVAESMKPGLEQTRAQLDLAKMYCVEKNGRCFELAAAIVDRLDDLVATASKLDGYDNRYLRDGEWTMTAEGGVGSALTSLALDAGYYAWADFDRAVELSGRFSRPEIRMMSQLKLAQGILAGPPARPAYGSPIPEQPILNVPMRMNRDSGFVIY